MPITENTAKHDVTPVAKPGEAHETAAQEAQKKLAAEATAAAKAKAEAEAAAKAKAQADAIAKAKAEAEAKAKGDAKPEAPKDGKSTGWLDMIESSASKAAGAIWDSATSVLPVLNLIHSDSTNRAVEKKEDGQLDLKKLVSDTCSGNSCKVDSTTYNKDALPGFEFIKKDVQDDKSPIMMQKDYVSAKDMEAINKCFEAVCKNNGAPLAFDARKFLQGDVHQSTDGTVAVRSGDTTAFKNPDGTLTTADIHGLISQKDKDGKLIFQLNKEGHFTGAMQNGNIIDIDPKTVTMRMLDKNGKPAVEVHNGKSFEIVGEFKNGKVVISEKEITPKTMIDLLREAREEAKASGKPQVRTWINGQFVVQPDGSAMGLQSDGTAILSVSSDKYLVRNHDGSYLLFTEGGAEPEKLNRSEVEEVLKHHHVEAAIIAAALLRMRHYERCHKLEGANHTSVSLINGVLQSTVADTVQTTQSGNKVVATDLSTGQKIEADVKAKTVKATDDQGQTTDIQGTATGFNVAGNGWKYNDGKVTTSNGDVIENGNIHFANGTTYHNNGSTTFKDGSSFNADGSVTDHNGVRHTAAEAQAVAVKEAQAASMTAYAEGIAGSLRSLASSGHASLGDLAALESAYSSICSAVMALGAECDPAARVKLMMAQDDIGSSLEATLAALTQPDPQTLKVEEALSYARNNGNENADNVLASLQYQSMNSGSISPVAA